MSKSENKPTINDKIDQLHAMADWFYGDDFNLDEALDRYRAAVKLTKEIEKDLSELKNRVEVINKDFTEPDF